MIDFSHLSKLKIKKEKTVDYNIDLGNGIPVFTLKLKPATQDNPEFTNFIMNSDADHVVRIGKSQKIDDEAIQKNMIENIKLLSNVVVVDWDNVLDSSGEVVEYSQENCFKFLKQFADALPTELTKLIAFASDYSNFVDKDITVIEPTVKAKN